MQATYNQLIFKHINKQRKQQNTILSVFFQKKTAKQYTLCFFSYICTTAY